MNRRSFLRVVTQLPFLRLIKLVDRFNVDFVVDGTVTISFYDNGNGNKILHLHLMEKPPFCEIGKRIIISFFGYIEEYIVRGWSVRCDGLTTVDLRNLKEHERCCEAQRKWQTAETMARNCMIRLGIKKQEEQMCDGCSWKTACELLKDGYLK